MQGHRARSYVSHALRGPLYHALRRLVFETDGSWCLNICTDINDCVCVDPCIHFARILLTKHMTVTL